MRRRVKERGITRKQEEVDYWDNERQNL